MTIQKTGSCSVLAVILWLWGAQAGPSAVPAPQRDLASADEAVTAFVAALRNNQIADLRAILGPGADRAIDSGDKYADRELHSRFVALYDEKHGINQQRWPCRIECQPG